MDCRIHDRAKGMICSRCADTMCPLCAEFINGSWYCPDCAITERRIAAGLDYRDFIAVNYGEPAYGDEASGNSLGEI